LQRILQQLCFDLTETTIIRSNN